MNEWVYCSCLFERDIFIVHRIIFVYQISDDKTRLRSHEGEFPLWLEPIRVDRQSVKRMARPHAS